MKLALLFKKVKFIVYNEVDMNCGNREDIYLLTLFLLFKFPTRETKEVVVSLGNSSLVGTLITIGEVTDSFRYTYIVLTSARAVLGKYRPEVLTVGTSLRSVRTKKTKGRYSPNTVPSKLG